MKGWKTLLFNLFVIFGVIVIPADWLKNLAFLGALLNIILRHMTTGLAGWRKSGFGRDSIIGLFLVLFFSCSERTDSVSFLLKRPKPNESGGSCAYDVDPWNELSDIRTIDFYIAKSDTDSVSYSGGLYSLSNIPDNELRARIENAVSNISGSFVMIGESMSMGRDEWNGMIDSLAADGNVNQGMIFVNLGQSSCHAGCWTSGNGGSYSPASEVRIILEKQTYNGAQSQYEPLQTFPQHAERLRDEILLRLSQLEAEYPNAELVIFTSRAFAGWSCAEGEYRSPVAYEEAFAVKWAIETWNSDTTHIPAMWGPYLWDNTQPRSYFAHDGAHPSSLGIDEVSHRWMEFFRSDTSVSKVIYSSSPPPGGNTSPLAEIYSPGDTSVSVGSSVLFSGDATDLEDGVVDASGFLWRGERSNKGKTFAVGVKSGSFIPNKPGTYLLILDVTDSGGLMGSDTVTVMAQ